MKEFNTPADEVRLVQIELENSPDGHIYGLDDYGRLWVLTDWNLGWEPMNMKKAKLQD